MNNDRSPLIETRRRPRALLTTASAFSAAFLSFAHEAMWFAKLHRETRAEPPSDRPYVLADKPSQHLVYFCERFYALPYRPWAMSFAISGLAHNRLA